MDRIKIQSDIWDLHIHTCCCPKASSEFKNMSKEKYVNQIISIFNNKPELALFSFTDHNVISIDVYEEYMNQNGQTNFLVGVEQDTYFDEDPGSDYKHLIIYFDINSDNFSERISFMEDYNKTICGKPQKVHTLLSFLVGKNIKFVLSPHAFKQGKRAINNSWNDEETVKQEAHKYLDQFFCFWEAQGYSDIARAEQFLRDFDLDQKKSIISFSDSNNFSKLKSYLDNPFQWFNSLPTYKGLELIASESNRISRKRRIVCENSFGNLIGKIEVDGQTIELSDKLNCIIGGRGSGKSLLLDGIANNLKDVTIDDRRKEYMDRFDIKVFNYAGGLIERNNFEFDYYKQSYVSMLFEENDYYDNIKEQFRDELSKIEEIEINEIQSENKNRFIDYLKDFNHNNNLSNISGLLEKYSVIKDNTLELSLGRLQKDTSIKYEKYNNLYGKILKLLPKDLSTDKDINENLEKFVVLVLDKIHENNLDFINGKGIKNLSINKYSEYKKQHNDKNKNKIEVEELFKNTFDEKGLDYLKRVNIINAYLNIQINFVDYYEKQMMINGEEEDAFVVKKVLKIENPLEYLSKNLKEYFYSKDLKGNTKEFDLYTAINYYCFETNKILKDGKSIDQLDETLLNFDLNYDDHPQILYRNDAGDYEDVLYVSPGTQTNILMEYLVHKDSDKPILIDQPEDNVDNQTIYNKLRVWFEKLKRNRQVIVVTHDANIVINADAENIIVANHSKKDTFNYSYGALEYGDNLEIASNVLDGGKEAVKRRLMKYGTE